MNTSPPAARRRHCARRASLVLHWNKTRAPVDRRRIYTTQDTATSDATSKHAVSAASVAQQLRGKRREGMGDSRVQGQGPDKGSGDEVAQKLKHFCYPRDTTLARVLVMALCLCMYVCLSVSVTSRCHIETSGRIELFFWCGCFLRPAVHWKFRCLQSKRTFSGNFVPNSGLRKCRHARDVTSIVATFCQHSWTKVDAQSVINWTVGQLS